MRKVALELLKPDMVLAKPIYHLNSLLLKVGTSHLERFKTSLSKLGITHLYVTDRLSEDIIVEDTINQETRLHCKEVLFSTINALSNQGVLETERLSESTDEILDEILKNTSVLTSMNEIGTSDDSTFNHSINVAIYSMLVAKQLHYPRVRAKKLAMGLLLHDIGKTMVNQKILYKPGRLTKEEYEHVKTHTVLGYEVLKKNDSLTELSRIVALSHHERLDGSGYPNRIKGKEIHEFVRIAAVVDIYDALISERCYHKKKSIYEAVALLKDEAVGKLDAGLVSTIIKCIAIYPNGTMVKLTDGTAGIVKYQNPDMPYRPVVRVISDPLGRPVAPSAVNLATENGIRIQEANYRKE